MTVSELIEILEKLKQNDCGNYQVIVACDGEGNRYSPLDEIEIGYYQKETDWWGYFVDENDYDNEYEDEQAICLWPVN